MKTRSESAVKPKGNGSGKPARVAGSPDALSAKPDRPREQMIAEAAYFRAEQRGFAPGGEMSDWLQADADVDAVLRNIR